MAKRKRKSNPHSLIRIIAAVVLFGIYPVIIFFFGVKYQSAVSYYNGLAANAPPQHFLQGPQKYIGKDIPLTNIFYDKNLQPTLHELENEQVTFTFAGMHGLNGPRYGIFIKRQPVGEIIGYPLDPSLSPGHAYFAFRTSEGTARGRGAEVTRLGIIDFSNDTFIVLSRPPQSYAGPETGSVYPYIEAYTWDGDDALLISYSYRKVTLDAKGNPSGSKQVSTTKVWEYDLPNEYLGKD